MAKRKTLPKDFEDILRKGDLAELKTVFEKCDINAYGGVFKEPVLAYSEITPEFAKWLIDQGADINKRDKYGNTPLHSHARAWNGNPQLLIDLGADMEATCRKNNSPLFVACSSHKTAHVKTLVHAGANINSTNEMGLSPLDYTLMTCQNIQIKETAQICDFLLSQGASTSDLSAGYVVKIGEKFEFLRDGFNEDMIPEIDVALRKLYSLFNVEPVTHLNKHDGIAKIVVGEKSWQAHHGELWEYLVPGSGHAKTVQGEVIRISGKIGYEILDNGGINWGADYRKMATAFTKLLSLHKSVEPADIELAKQLMKQLPNIDEEINEISRIAVEFVKRNPSPIDLPKQDYFH